MRLFISLLVLLSACPIPEPLPEVDGGAVVDVGQIIDAGQQPDAGGADAAADTGTTGDAGLSDGGQTADGGSSDAGPADAGFQRGTAEYYGERLYRYYCGFCHGYQGEGYRSDNANALAHPNFLRSATETFWRDAIIYGRPDTPMSAWGTEMGGPLRAIDISDIIAYVAYWPRPEPIEGLHEQQVTGDAVRGLEVYREMACDECHGEDGSGVTAPSVNNPWLLESASDGFLRYAIAEGRPTEGNPDTDMPAYGDILAPQEIDDLVVLLRSWATPVNRDPPPPFEPDLTDHLINPEGQPADFTPREDTFYVPAQQVYDQMMAGRKMVLVDARAASDYLVGHISGAVSLPFYRVEEAIEILPRDVWIIAYCGCPHAVSGRVAQALIDAGFELAGVLDEGYYHWRDNRWPVRNGRERF